LKQKETPAGNKSNNKTEKKVRKPGGRKDQSVEESRRLQHELRTHQIELEMQNEELRMAHGELEESRVRYRELYDFAPIGYFTFDADGLIKEANLTGASLLGVNKQSLLGRPFSVFVAASHRADFRACCEELLRHNSAKTCDILLQKKDGSQFFARLDGVPYADSKGRFFCRTIVSDISERKRMEQALAEREQYFRLLTEKSTDVITILDAEGKIRYVSPSGETVIGYDPHDLAGRSAFELIHPDDRDRALNAFQEALRSPDKSYTVECRVRHKDGSWRYFETIGRNLLHEPIISGILVNSRDITDRKTAEIKLANMSDELKLYNAELEKFASAVSHDLREPLRTIGFFLNLLEKRYKGKFDSKADEFIYFTLDSVKRMDLLIKELVDFSHLQTQKRVLKPVDLTVALEKSIMDLHSAIDESGAQITYDPLPTVEADELQITRLFQNLLSNSIKFRSEEKPKIHVSAERKDDEWVFSVRDNGIGLDPKFSDRIFVVFQRLHTMLEYDGTGMGLAMCKKIVALHKGRIWVESEPGKGATFFFSIPAGQAAS